MHGTLPYVRRAAFSHDANLFFRLQEVKWQLAVETTLRNYLALACKTEGQITRKIQQAERQRMSATEMAARRTAVHTLNCEERRICQSRTALRRF